MSRSAWQARLALQFAARGGRTVLSQRRHHGPLLVQRPFYPEGGICHVYLVHPPGGVVGGDQLALQVEVGAAAQVLLTTPAATKFYRAGPHPAAQVHQQLQVHAAAALEWLPQETILFDGARARAVTEVRLEGDARFFGWEIACLARPANGETLRHGALAQDLLLYRDDVPLLLDRLRLQGGSPALRAPWGLAGLQALGTLVMTPAPDIDLAPLRALDAPDVRFGMTRVQDVLVCRALSMQAEAVRDLFTRLWLQLRPALLGCAAVTPRIWAT